MCGIAGIVSLNGEAVPAVVIRRMTDSVAHRGPDGEGCYTDGPVGLGHRRLAIIDLSPAGHQPMMTGDARYVITYNGEVYNFQELRLELEASGHQFRSRNDTEVLLQAYAQWGEACVERLNGMFAFAVWDRVASRLVLARDRYGVKPLYYLLDGTRLIFASEVKAILACPNVSRAVCYPALNEYFTFQNTLTDLTLFEGVRMLQPGHTLTVDTPERRVHCRRYWDFELTTGGPAQSEQAAAEEVYQCFNQAVARHLVSDVPVASYLSGGLDSSSIAAVAVRNVGRITTFTGGFDLSSASGLELGFDERANSEVLSNLLKTEHYEIVLHAGDMEHVMPELIWHLEDLRVGQCYPNYYVARLAGRFVKVVLSGTGGDELFAGYPWRYYRALDGDERRGYYRSYYDFWQRLVPDEEKPELFAPSVHRAISDHSTFEVFRGVFPSAIPLDTPEDRVNASLYFELKTFLHGLLVVEDKVSMAHSLEARVPFLDNDLVDLACRLPPSLKLRDITQTVGAVDENEPGKRLRFNSQTQDGKRILRQAFSRLVPPAVTERVKQGFSAPDASWFRGESIDYVNGLLRNPAAPIYEYLNRDYVVRRLNDHCAGRRNDRLFIWSVLSFDWWLKRFLN